MTRGPTANIFVAGVPVPKGSTRAFRHNKTGRIVTWQSNRERLQPWQNAIWLAARQAGLQPVAGPVRLELTFYLPRPQGHLGARGLRPSAPGHHCNKPDLDKLVRAVLDALTTAAYADDSQVVAIESWKLWAEPSRRAGVAIRVWQDWGARRRER